MFLGRPARLLERFAFLCWVKTRYLYFLRNSSIKTCYVIISDHWTKWYYNHHRRMGKEHISAKWHPRLTSSLPNWAKAGGGGCQFSQLDTSFTLIIASQDICSFFCFSGTFTWNPWVSPFTSECLSVWQKQAKVWDGSKGTLRLSMVHNAEFEIKRTACCQGTHRLYNMPHIIQCM